MRQALDSVAELLERNGKRVSDLEFPDFAERVLQEASLHESVNPTSLLNHVFSEEYTHDEKKLHSSSNVIPLISTDHYQVMAHLWMDDFADLHSHDWSGAFQVVCGDAIHFEYSFIKSKAISKLLSIGSLEFTSSKRITRGDIVKVHPGLRMVHGVCHLPRPSLTISVRRRCDYTQPFNIYKDVALATNATSQEVRNYLKILNAYKAIDFNKYLEKLKYILKKLDIDLTYILLKKIREYNHVPENLYTEIIHDWLDGETLRNAFIPSLLEQNRQPLFYSRWKLIHDRSLREFMAFLFLSKDRETMLKSIQETKGYIAEECILDWLEKINELLGIEHRPFLVKAAKSLFILEGDPKKTQFKLIGNAADSRKESSLTSILELLIRSPFLSVLFK
ncbi:hypothetical protein [Prochlorococcus sp. MIT 1201]|uniref:hypothetical protein n=1 Tax=Prochlorococcus sp. MIT 1201 TaxID=3082535 RepID=UPI0039A43846